MRRKIIIAGGIIVIAGAVVWFARTPRTAPQAPSSGASFAQGQANGSARAQNSLLGTHVSVDGFIICLPHRNTSDDALDNACVIGLESADEKTYYGLIDQNHERVSPEKVTTGSRTTISGTLTSDVDLETRYAIQSVIQMDSAPRAP